MIHLLSLEILIQTIRSNRPVVFRVGGDDTKLAFGSGSNSFVTHEFGDGVLGQFDPLFLEFSVHSRASVVVHSWLLVNSFDFFDGLLSLHAGRGRLGLLPLVVRGSADLQHAALNRNGPSQSMLEDELEPQ